jgi:pimeloyl-ACP methyl ester carboxylesterase
MNLADAGLLPIDSRQLEYRMVGPRPDTAPTLVMLHEGLGSAALWGDFLPQLSAATGTGVFAYSRAGYGRSSPMALPWPVSYMHDEARDVLPKLLDAIGFQRGLLCGHSDGASIATIYAGSHQDHRVRGLALMAPHFFVEDVSIAAIAEAREAYVKTDLRERLARWHANVDVAFRGWNDVWLNPEFRAWDITEMLAYVRVPILIVQGEDDQYGTPRQIAVAQEECYCPVEVALLPDARHSPYKEAPAATLAAMAGFVNRLLKDHAEGVAA